MWIDAHCHLDFPWETSHPSPQEISEMVRRAQAAKVSKLINVGCSLTSSLEGLALSQQHDSVWCTLGVHPNESDEWSVEVEERFLKEIEQDRASGNPRVVGIGEIGLDYFRNGASKEIQESAFRAQLRLAKATDLPVVIHCRDAFEDTFRVLGEEEMKAVVFHCYSGDLAQAEQIWKKRWTTSFTAVASYPKNDELREVIRRAPADLYFIETDAPFLPHQSLRGKRNEPAFLVHLGELVAELRGKSVEWIAKETTRNAGTFFRREWV